MSDYEYKGKEFKFYYLDTCTAITNEDREHICQQAAQMYIERDKKRTISDDNFECQIKDSRKSFTFGGLYGKLFDINIETSKGKFKMSFLVNKFVNPSLN